MAKSGESLAHGQQQEEEQRHVRWSKYSRRVVLSTILGRSDGGLGLVGERVVVGGWVKSCKEAGRKDVSGPPHVPVVPEDVTCSEVLMTRIPLLRSIARLFVSAGAGPHVQKPDSGPDKASPAVVYLRINDGSCVANLQIVIDSSMSLLAQVMHVGTSVLVEGVLKQPLIRRKHLIELVVEKVIHVGIADLNKYPLAKSRLSLEFLRLYSHLRPRTTTVASITRIRNGLSCATNTFFQNNGFLHVHMPVITTTDSRGGNERFQVTTLFSKSDSTKDISPMDDRAAINLDVVRAAIKEKSNRIEELKRSDSNREALAAALLDLKKANELAFQLEIHQKSNSGTSLKVEKADFSKDFFSQPAYLSFSAGLHLESYACALSSVYTFGPIFQAKKSESKRQLAEMWMVEVELAFSELEDVMNCAEDYLKFMCQSILENCSDDITIASKRIDKNCIDRLQSVGSIPFKKITYMEAVEVLKKVTDKTFETETEWGISLSEEHECYLADEIYKSPIIIYDHPKEVQPFYVRLRDDGRTVSSFDIIVPKVGALIRGSQREERIDMISARIDELGLPREQYEWYLELRRHGTIKHAGFSLGFENMVMFATGINDARDVIPFPRTSGNANA